MNWHVLQVKKPRLRQAKNCALESLIFLVLLLLETLSENEKKKSVFEGDRPKI